MFVIFSFKKISIAFLISLSVCENVTTNNGIFSSLHLFILIWSLFFKEMKSSIVFLEENFTRE